MYRDLRFDIFRGIALIAIMLNHAFAEKHMIFRIEPPFFFNFAEIFVFISACVSTFANHSMVKNGELSQSFFKAIKRCGEIYFALLAIVFFAVLSIDLINAYVPNLLTKDQINFLGLSPFIPFDPSAIYRLLTLQSLPSFCHVLVLYLFFLPLLPFWILAVRKNAFITLCSSIVIYGYAQFLPLKGEASNGLIDPLRSIEIWHHPLAYQLIFTIGVICGVAVKEKKSILESLGLSQRFNAISNVVLILGALILASIDFFLKDHSLLKPFVQAQNTGLLRVIGFVWVLLMVAKWSNAQQAIWRSSIALVFAEIGQKSLRLFALGILWSQALIVIQEAVYFQTSVMIAWSLLAIMSMYLFALTPKQLFQNDWIFAQDRNPARANL
jgi:hypothetical protein